MKEIPLPASPSPCHAHLQYLQQLPMGSLVLDENHRLRLWNRALQLLTGMNESQVLGLPLCALASPWTELFDDFINKNAPHRHKQRLILAGKTHWLNLHKAGLGEQGLLVLVEDISETWLLEKHLMHSERLASIGRLAAGVAHEIGNPITAIACLAQNLREERENDAEIAQICQQIIEQSKRVSRIVRSLLGFAHAGVRELAREPVNLAQLAAEAIALLSLDQQSTPVVFHNLCAPEHVASGDAPRLLQVLLNLLANARDASPPGAAIRIRSTIHEDSVELLVEDQGSGIPKDLKNRLFEPFFTTKEPGQGTGLGLALAYAIVEEHHGQITLDSPSASEPLGSCFRVRLPSYTAEPSSAGA
ncbi:hypothetical protein AXE65_07725 [Ventosimonas gracilis]|uniref:histidine kinase n=1 Tax=Ventosimonas gracilis TaxID=1680762 RepID=A0A139SHT8_9GAMM|nr:hypothetical protein AXE65_07725 [Ventosimonas gracilis]